MQWPRWCLTAFISPWWTWIEQCTQFTMKTTSTFTKASSSWFHFSLSSVAIINARQMASQKWWTLLQTGAHAKTSDHFHIELSCHSSLWPVQNDMSYLLKPNASDDLKLCRACAMPFSTPNCPLYSKLIMWVTVCLHGSNQTLATKTTTLVNASVVCMSPFLALSVFHLFNGESLS